MPRPKRFDAKAWVKLTKDELYQLQVRSIVADLPLSRYLVEAGLSDGRTLDAETRELQERLLFELRTVGRAIEKLTTRPNSSSAAPPEQIHKVLTRIDETVRLIRQGYRPL